MSAFNFRNDENGQAIFELLIFMPFLLLLTTVLLTMGESIFGSINQQKSVRGYFFYLVAHNSFIPPHDDLNALQGVKETGMYAFGWKENFKGGRIPLSPCYRILSLANGGNNPKENCSDQLTVENPTSNYIKVATVFGVCSASYSKPDSKFELNPLINRPLNTECTMK